MGKKSKAENIAKKKEMIIKCFELFSKHSQICLATLEHVGSNQVQQIRRIINEKKSTLVITKNTLLKKIIRMRSEPLDENKTPYCAELKKFGAPKPELKALIPHLHEKMALIFTDASVYELKAEIEKIMVAQEARVGTVSPIDLVIPPGPTGMDPSQISFFHALQISTKIQKAQIEINKEFKVCTKGRKVTTSEAALLKKLSLKPFFFGMKFFKCYDSGTILEEDVLGISPDDIVASFQAASMNLTAASLELGVPTAASVDFMMAQAVRNIAAISVETGVKVPGLEIGAGGAPAAQPEAKKEDKKKEEKKKEPEPKKEEEEEEYGFGDLF